MSYTKTNWVNNQAPAINATNLNNIENGIANSYNVALLAVDDTAPSECSTGDKYYNTTTKKIYTATGTDTWGTTGEDPLQDIFYIVFDTKTSYSYDGTDLVSVGGGGAEIAISTTTPTEDEIVWINPNESVDVYGSYISNEYGTSQTIGYSQEFINGVELYNDATGGNGNITLSDNINNYRYIEIYASWATEYCLPAVKLSTEDLTNNKFYISWNDVGNDKTIFNKQYTISGTSITKISMSYYIINKSETSTWDECRIHRVVGYK